VCKTYAYIRHFTLYNQIYWPRKPWHFVLGFLMFCISVCDSFDRLLTISFITIVEIDNPIPCVQEALKWFPGHCRIPGTFLQHFASIAVLIRAMHHYTHADNIFLQMIRVRVQQLECDHLLPLLLFSMVLLEDICT
jgi:hypothetical protein